MVATLRDVARAAGVHPGTASRAMNPETEQLVNHATVMRVRKAAKALGYVPNPVARSLKTSRSQSLGAVIPDITNPLFPPIIRGFEDVVAEAGYNVLVTNTDNDAIREGRQIAELRARQVEGMIVATATIEDEALRQLVADHVPVVLVNRVEPNLAVPSVAGDDASGIRQAVAHLKSLGHRRVAHLAGPQTTSTGIARLRAFRQELTDQGLEFDEALVVLCDQYREADGKAALEQLLDGPEVFSAVIAANDLLALGCYDAMKDRNLSCPSDLSVVGFNDMPFVDKVHPPLTTIHVPHYEVGAEAARIVLERIKDPGKSPISVLLPVSLIVRDSTTAATRS